MIRMKRQQPFLERHARPEKPFTWPMIKQER
jgi:hypothetical protein